MPSEQQLIEREQKREFFIQTPALVDYLPLTPHEFRLYSHYVRVCGDDGQCWESVRTTAAHCRMGLGTVVRAREALEETYKLIYTNKDAAVDGGTINIRIRDIWPINSHFLALIRRHGMPSLKASEAWLLAQLRQEEVAYPFDMNEQSDNPDDYFKVEEHSTPTERPSHGKDGGGVPQWNTPFHGGTPCSTVEQSARQGNAARAGGTHCSTVEPNKIYINKIPLDQISSNQIPIIAAAAAEGPLSDPVQVSGFVSEDHSTYDLDPRAEGGESDELLFDDRIWWNNGHELVSRSAVERVCKDLMSLDGWRDEDRIIQAADTGELLNLLHWLGYAQENDLPNVDNVPGYIRSRLNERRGISGNKMDDLKRRIQGYSEQYNLPY